jgi:hypothetical protein
VACGLVMLASVAAGCTKTASTGTTTTRATSTVPPPATSTTTAPTTAPGDLGPEQVPVPSGPPLGPINTAVYGRVIDGIQCQTNEQVVYHIHAHLAVFVDGQPRQVPLGIGIGPPLELQHVSSGDFVAGGSCFYWLHTHASDGVMHIESPTQKQYTLGEFFDVWGQNLTAGQVGPEVGTVTALVDGQVYSGDPRAIPLASHTLIQLDVGTVVPPHPIVWPSGL